MLEAVAHSRASVMHLAAKSISGDLPDSKVPWMELVIVWTTYRGPRRRCESACRELASENNIHCQLIFRTGTRFLLLLQRLVAHHLAHELAPYASVDIYSKSRWLGRKGAPWTYHNSRRCPLKSNSKRSMTSSCKQDEKPLRKTLRYRRTESLKRTRSEQP